MIQLIVGGKGSGKTKKMIDMINDSGKTPPGNIVCIEKSMKLTYDIDHAARLIDVDEYKISGYDMLYGFIAGILAGNYDIVEVYLDGVLTEFDSIIGLRRLKAIHLNDSKNPPGSRKDRHACLGEGTIGLEALGRIVRHPALKDLPFCLETPNDLPGYAREIALMREMAEA